MKNKKALILISVLWTLLILLVLALGLNFRTRYFSVLARNRLDVDKTIYVLYSGLEYCVSSLEKDDKMELDSSKDAFFDNPKDFQSLSIDVEKSLSFLNKEGNITRFGLKPLNSKLNLNYLIPKQIEKIKDSSDFKEEQWAALLDWIDGDSDPRNHGSGAEQSFYDSRSPSPLVPNKPLTSWDSLYLIHEMNDAFANYLKEHFTLIGDGKVNIHFADKDTLLWMDYPPTLADKIKRFLAGEDEIFGTQDDNQFTSLTSISKDLNEYDPLFPEENSALTNSLPMLDLASPYLLAHIQATIQKRTNPYVLEAVIEKKNKKANVVQVSEFYE